VAHEFNTADHSRNASKYDVFGIAQWSPAKVQDIHRLRREKIDSLALQRAIDEARERPHSRSSSTRRAFRLCRRAAQYECSRCGNMKPVQDFILRPSRPTEVPYACRSCESEMNYAYRSTLRGSLKTTLHSAHHRDLHRGRTSSLTFDDMLDLLLKQEQRCYYSGVPMCIIPNTHWRLSLERLNNDLGYTLSNCVLVAAEFNTRAQWSKEKVELIWGSFDLASSHVTQ